MVVYLVFGNTKVNWWWNRFLKPGYQHCFAFVQHGDKWIRIDGEKESLVVCLDNPVEYVKGHKLVKVVQKTGGRGIFSLSTCVALCKKAIGMRNPFVLTPYQLYKAVKKWQS